MEKAILKTLIYADIFDYPLKISEIHKWLVGKKATLRQVEEALQELSQKSKVKSQNGYYFLPRRNELVAKRIRKEKQSQIYFRKAKMLSWVLKLIPWIKLVGISGGLAMNNAGKSDDIDLFIITAEKRLWISRLLALGLLSLTGQRRKFKDKGRKIAGKVCINTLLESSSLEQSSKDIFIAHEVLQMRPLWCRGRIYEKYLLDNQWVFKYLPNWVGSQYQISNIKYQKRRSNIFKFSNFHFDFLIFIFDILERLAGKFQLQIMSKPRGAERIQDGALYFHPKDCRLKVLEEYKKRLAIISP